VRWEPKSYKKEGKESNVRERLLVAQIRVRAASLGGASNDLLAEKRETVQDHSRRIRNGRDKKEENQRKKP